MHTYAAAEVDPIIQDLASQVEAALLVAQDAQAKLAAAQVEKSVVLQKVAAFKQTPSLDPKLIDETLSNLEDFQIILPSGREKIASDLAMDPNNALRLLSRALTLSAEAPQQGQGVPKSASVFHQGHSQGGSESDPDGWGLVVKHGA